jgi:AcrR family transcriptional regulator
VAIKTEARRQAIVTAAWRAFKENGFERTTMSEINERVGGSKGTLYSYFKSKEELFVAALDAAVADQADLAFHRLNQAGPMEERLAEFARRYMVLRLSDDVLAIDRILVAEADRHALGRRLYTEFVTPRRQALAAVMAGEMAAGRLRRADTLRAAAHFFALVEVDLLERRRQGDTSITSEEIDATVESGVATFLRAYKPCQA